MIHYSTVKKISSSIIITLYLLLLFTSFLIQPVSAQTITRAPVSGAVGASVTITGSAFLPNVSAQVFYDGLQVGNATTSSIGGFKVIFAVPSSSRGSHNIWAVDGVNNASTTFTVTNSLTRAPTSGIVGTTITLTGYGYAASSLVTVKWDGMALATSPASVTTDSNGAFVATVLAPVGEPVSHDIVVSDAGGSVTQTFTLNRNIVLSPITGPTGTTVQVTGSGYLASNPISITFENVIVATTPAVITSNVYGGFTASFVVPTAAPGARTVKALDNTGGSATATFTVTPSITLSVATGRGGTAVTVTGAGFTPTNTVQIKFNTTLLFTAPTDASGGFSQSITIPFSARGVYVISANDTLGKTATATFTVTPLIAITPAAGSAGTYVTVTGSGFSVNTMVIVIFGGTQMTTVPSTITTDSYGAFTASFLVPLVGSGTWNVRAQDSFGYQSTTTFAAGLNLVFSVARGTVGTVVTVNGLGFASMSHITFTFDSIVLSTTPPSVTSDALGIFQATFAIPESSGQNHLIVVNDSAGNRVSTAFTVDESISLNQSSGDVGTNVLVMGTGFRQANFVTITFDSNVIATTPNPVLTNSNGSFSASFIVPTANPGARTVRATDNIGNLASATFTLTPSLTLSVATGRGGTTTSITGTGFAALSMVSIKFDGNTILAAPTDSTGWFRQAIMVPFVPAGAHIIQVVDAASQTATATFTVTPTFTLSRTSGTVGAFVAVTGVGFAAFSNISMTFAGVPLNTTPSVVTTNAFGGFTCSFYVPSGSAGVWTIRAIDASSNKIDTTFTIVRRFILSVVTGVVGRAVTAQGAGYAPGSQVIITYDTVVLSTNPPVIIANANGTFNATFSIPESIYGYHTITATDAVGGSISVTFTTTTSIIINPSNGDAGTVINVTGTGFGDLATVTITFDAVPMTTNPISVKTNALGSFSAQFTVLSYASGAHTVRAFDTVGYAATATFTNPRQITLDDRDGYSLAALTMTGVGFTPLSTISLTWDGEPLNALPSPLTANGTGSFTAFFTVPKDTAGFHYINATDLSDHKAANTYNIVPYISITPEGRFQDDLVWITGRGFSGSSMISLTWDGAQLVSTPPVIMTDPLGDFTASFPIPVNSFGYHRVVAVDQMGKIVSVQYLISSSIIDVSLVVSPLHFKGEIAEFVALVSQKGQPFNASTVTANLYQPNGTMQNLTASIVKIDTGTYRVNYTVPGGSPAGTYTLVLYVSRDFDGILCTGSALGAFQVSETFNLMNATLGDLNGTVATLSLDTGPIIIKLDEINATLAALNTSSSGEVLALINTTSGTIISKLDSIYAKINSVQGNIATISSSVGSIKVLLSDIAPIITGLNNSNFTIQTDLGPIEVTLDDLQIRSIGIENDLVQIETEIGWIIATLENLTGLSIEVPTQDGVENLTLFSDMNLLTAEYRQSDHAIVFSCEKGSEDKGAISVLVTRETMDSIGTTPSEVKLLEEGKEIPVTTIELPKLYVFQATQESFGQQSYVLELKGAFNLLSMPLLLLGGLGFLVVFAGSFFLMVLKRESRPFRKARKTDMKVMYVRKKRKKSKKRR